MAKKTKKKAPTNILELKGAIEGLSLSNEIDPESVAASIKEVIREELSNYLDILDSDIAVDIDNDYRLSLFIKKRITDLVEHPILDITPSEVEEKDLKVIEEDDSEEEEASGVQAEENPSDFAGDLLSEGLGEMLAVPSSEEQGNDEQDTEAEETTEVEETKESENIADLDESIEEDKKENTPHEQRALAPLSLDVLTRGDIRDLNHRLIQQLRELKTKNLYKEFKQKEGTLLSGAFLRRLGRDIIIHLGDSEGKLGYREQIHGERYKQGDTIKVYLKEVSLERNRMQLHLSRTDARFVIKLFENEVEELAEGIVKVKSIVREIGRKTKIAVYSERSDVEPVGACVGLYGNRIKAVMKELGNERIDVIAYTSNIKHYIARALDVGQIKEILLINREQKEALVVVDDESYPMVIGRSGVNVKLASRLVGWEISIRKESQISKHPGILKIFSRIDHMFDKDDSEEDLTRLTGIDEETLVKIMNSGVNTVADLYEKSEEAISKIEGIGKEKAKDVRRILDEMVELVEEEAELLQETEVMPKLEMEEEIQQIEFLSCPSCQHEFEYSGGNKCPKCGTEFEFED